MSFLKKNHKPTNHNTKKHPTNPSLEKSFTSFKQYCGWNGFSLTTEARLWRGLFVSQKLFSPCMGDLNTCLPHKGVVKVYVHNSLGILLNAKCCLRMRGLTLKLDVIQLQAKLITKQMYQPSIYHFTQLFC